MELKPKAGSKGSLSRQLSLTATFAAVYTVFRLVPISRTIGINGTITGGGIIIPIVVLFLDLPFAIASVFIGTFIAFFAPWNPVKFYGLDFLPGVMFTTVAGLVFRGKRVTASAVLVLLLGVFTVTPNTEVFVGSKLLSPPIPFYWMHLLALAVLLSPVAKRVPALAQASGYWQMALVIGVLAFTGTMTEHITGGILTGLIFGPGVLKAWPAIFLVYPIERLIIVLFSVVVGVPVAWNTLRQRRTLEAVRTRIV